MSHDEVRFSEPDIGDAEVDAAGRALRSGWITTGGECAALEKELADYLGVEHVVAMASCTAALEIAVARLGLPPGSRIGVPTWTFVASAIAPLHRDVVPVLLDIEPATFNIAPDALTAALEQAPGLDAVLGVHFAGTPLSEQIHRICADAGLPLIEDAAHALGASDHRGKVAGQGTAGCCFSFYATKNLTSAEGGALATDDEELARFAQSFRLHGMSHDAWRRYAPGAGATGYDLLGDGLKANLPDVLAAVARVQLERFPELQCRRRRLVERYRQQLADVEGLRVVPEHPVAGGADHLMMVVLPEATDRSAIQESLAADEIGTSVHFRPLHTFGWFADHGVVPGPAGVEVADLYAGRALSLPLHTGLSDGDVDRVCNRLAHALAR